MKPRQTGFTLVEIAIVLLIVTILLGYTVALFPSQQRLKQYRAVDRQMDQVMEAIIGFAQVNGRLPCPAQPDDVGLEDINGVVGCNTYAGFVPVNTLGLDGRFNADSLLLDPWGNPYRYYVTNVDFNGDFSSDFTAPGQMRLVGLVDSESHTDPTDPPGDGYIDLDGRYMICNDRGGATDDDCLDQDNTVFGRRDVTAGVDELETRYGGAPIVLLSMGKNWREDPGQDELENRGATATPALLKGPTGNSYWLKNVVAGDETTFVRRLDGMADDFDDVVRWVSPSVLFSRMIQADQLP
jgi:prepilin-type N-terminal cleavage/methylation domain-containing protein